MASEVTIDEITKPVCGCVGVTVPVPEKDRVTEIHSAHLAAIKHLTDIGPGGYFHHRVLYEGKYIFTACETISPWALYICFVLCAWTKKVC